jgi:hypothetical protein
LAIHFIGSDILFVRMTLGPRSMTCLLSKPDSRIESAHSYEKNFRGDALQSGEVFLQEHFVLAILYVQLRACPVGVYGRAFPDFRQMFSATAKSSFAGGPSFRAFGERVGFRAAGDGAKSGFLHANESQFQHLRSRKRM